ncbi:protein of unknown function [Burkholderia multivorans]
MRVCIHRGSKQIGGSCIELEAKGQRIVLDLEPVRFLVCRGHETITELTSYDRCNSDQEEQESEGTEAVSR